MNPKKGLLWSPGYFAQPGKHGFFFMEGPIVSIIFIPMMVT